MVAHRPTSLNTQGQHLLLSVIVPTFDRPGLIKEALDSIRAQTYPHWEALAVDDGSAAETLGILDEYSRRDSRIRHLKRDRQPKGASTCRNIGLAAARGDYIVFLDSDDLLHPECLERRASAATENLEADFIVFQTLLFSQTPGDSDEVWNIEIGEPDSVRFLRGDSPWNTNSLIWKKSSVHKIQGFDESLCCWQDIDIHLRALLHGLRYQSCLCHEPDAFVRRHQEGGISQHGFKSREKVSSIFQVYQKSADAFNILQSPAVKSSLRQMLAHAVQNALDNRYFDLARNGIDAGARDGLLNFRDRLIWTLALAGYQVHNRGLRGCARLGKALMRPFQPSNSIGTCRCPNSVRSE